MITHDTAVNQVEFHSLLYQEELLSFCKDNNKIQLEAYSPLTRGKRLSHPSVVEVAKKYGKTLAQVLLRWSLQHDVIVILKSKHEHRILENSQVFDFQIESKDMILLDSIMRISVQFSWINDNDDRRKAN